MARKTLLLAAALAPLLQACGPSFIDAQQKDTIEAYEEYLKVANPNDPYYQQAQIRLEELYLKKAIEEGTLEAIDAYLARYPEGSNARKRNEALEEREKILYRIADAENTPEAWRKFLDGCKKCGKKKKAEAKRRLHMVEHLDKIRLSEVRIERVNLAENPEGPLDGWGFFVDVTNTGPVPIETLYLILWFLSDDGKVLDRKEWPAIARALPGNLPVEEEFKKPLKPGDVRTWSYTTGDLPEGWNGKVRVVPSHIVLQGEAKGQPELTTENPE